MEKVNQLLLEIKHLNLELKLEREEKLKLNEELKKAHEMIEQLINEKDKYKNHSNKNSSNSGKPSSTDMYKPKKTSPNEYNGRVRTGAKPGGQKGHEGHNLSKEKVEKMIQEEDIKVVEIKHYIKGNSKNEPVVKYKVGLTTTTYVEKHVFIFTEEYG